MPYDVAEVLERIAQYEAQSQYAWRADATQAAASNNWLTVHADGEIIYQQRTIGFSPSVFRALDWLRLQVIVFGRLVRLPGSMRVTSTDEGLVGELLFPAQYAEETSAGYRLPFSEERLILCADDVFWSSDPDDSDLSDADLCYVLELWAENSRN